MSVESREHVLEEASEVLDTIEWTRDIRQVTFGQLETAAEKLRELTELWEKSLYQGDELDPEKVLNLTAEVSGLMKAVFKLTIDAEIDRAEVMGNSPR